MRLRTSLLLGSAAFSLLAGCASTPKGPSEAPSEAPPEAPSEAPSPTPEATEPVKPSPPSTTASSASPWARARVGDRVVYSFSANTAPGRLQTEAHAIAGRLALEVVSVQQPWVWLKLSFTSDSGQPLTTPWLARELVLPVNMEASRSLDVPREGTETTESLSAAGREWEARRYLQDNRPSDGPLENRLYAVRPGPLYLTNGLLGSSVTLSGFGANGGSQLTLLEVRRGAEGGTAAPPAMERPLGPGTWYDIRVNVAGNDSVERTCLAAERGHVLRIQARAPTAGGAPCPSFAEAEVVPLEQLLVWLISEPVFSSGWPPPAATSRATFTAAGRTVPALTTETPEVEGTTRRIRFELYPADPWDASLAGLAHEARFRTLTEGVDRVGPQGKREPQDFTRLMGWGVWAGEAR